MDYSISFRRVLVIFTGILASTISIFLNSVQATIPEGDYLGTVDIFKPEFKYLAPVYGAAVYDQIPNVQGGMIANLYHFGEIPEKPIFRASEKLRTHDPVSAFIREVFVSQGPSEFNVTKKKDKVAFYLTPELLGRLQAVLTKATLAYPIPFKEEKEPEILKEISVQLLRVLENHLGEPSPAALEKTNLENELGLKQQNHRNALEGCQSEAEGAKERNKIISTLAQEIAKLNKRLEPIRSRVLTEEKRFPALKENAELFSRLLAESYIKCRKGFPGYPSALPEWILQSILHTKGTRKDDLRKFVTAMKDELGGQAAQVFQLDKDLSNEIFPASLYDVFEKKHEINKHLTQIASKYEWYLRDYGQNALAWASESYFESDGQELTHALLHSAPEYRYFIAKASEKHKEIPQFANYQGRVRYKKAEIPDCGETALRNFFTAMLKIDPNSSQLDLSLLKSVIKQGHRIENIEPANRSDGHLSVLDYFEKYPLATQVEDPKKHEDWLKVVSELPEVSYTNKKAGCDISGGVPNWLRVGEHILFGKIREGLPLSQRLTNLLALFSKENRQWSWKAKSRDGGSKAPDLDDLERQYDVRVAFSLKSNSHPELEKFSISFSPRHFESISHEMNWTHFAIPPASEVPHINLARAPLWDPTFGLFINGPSLDKRDQRKNSNWFSKHKPNLPLGNQVWTYSLFAPTQALESIKEICDSKDQFHYSLLANWVEKLALDDPPTLVPFIQNMEKCFEIPGVQDLVEEVLHSKVSLANADKILEEYLRINSGKKSDGPFFSAPFNYLEKRFGMSTLMGLKSSKGGLLLFDKLRQMGLSDFYFNTMAQVMGRAFLAEAERVLAQKDEMSSKQKELFQSWFEQFEKFRQNPPSYSRSPDLFDKGDFDKYMRIKEQFSSFRNQ